MKQSNIGELFAEEISALSSLPPPKVSFEFFPPKTQELTDKLWETIKILEPYKPSFISITYGAGGSTRERTHTLVSKVIKETSLKPAAHLTCVCATKEDINKIVKEYWDLGLRHIVALRGDPPDRSNKYIPHPGGYAFADELVKGIKGVGNFEISVAAYPETHPEATSPAADIEHLKRKVDAGATRAITQYFFDPDLYFRFMDRTRAAGIIAPIIPGIINVSNYDQIVRFSGMCKASIPTWMHEILAPIRGDEEKTKEASIRISAMLCTKLMQAGVKQFHFYSMNRPDMTQKLCGLLNINPR